MPPTSFKIYDRLWGSGDPYNMTLVDGTEIRQYLLTGLHPLQEYEVAIQAVGSNGVSGISNKRLGKTPGLFTENQRLLTLLQK